MPILPDGTNIETSAEWDEACLPQPLLAYLEPRVAEALANHRTNQPGAHGDPTNTTSQLRLTEMLTVMALVLGSGFGNDLIAILRSRIDERPGDADFWSRQLDIIASTDVHWSPVSGKE